MLVQCSRECTPPYLSTGISNLLQPAQAEVVLGQRSTYLASWLATLYKTSISVLYSAQCTRISEFCVQICLKSFVFNFACSSTSTFVVFAWSPPGQFYTSAMGYPRNTASGQAGTLLADQKPVILHTYLLAEFSVPCINLYLYMYIIQLCAPPPKTAF